MEERGRTEDVKDGTTGVPTVAKPGLTRANPQRPPPRNKKDVFNMMPDTGRCR